MTDWIDDVFEELDGRVVEMATRYRLDDLLETAYTEGHDHDEFLRKIYSEELTQDGVTELFRQLNERQPLVRDMYAPNQTMLARWIRSFCLQLPIIIHINRIRNLKFGCEQSIVERFHLIK
jgi:hypothetical protein